MCDLSEERLACIEKSVIKTWTPAYHLLTCYSYAMGEGVLTPPTKRQPFEQGVQTPQSLVPLAEGGEGGCRWV